MGRSINVFNSEVIKGLYISRECQGEVFSRVYNNCRRHYTLRKVLARRGRSPPSCAFLSYGVAFLYASASAPPLRAATPPSPPFPPQIHVRAYCGQNSTWPEAIDVSGSELQVFALGNSFLASKSSKPVCENSTVRTPIPLGLGIEEIEETRLLLLGSIDLVERRLTTYLSPSVFCLFLKSPGCRFAQPRW